MSDEAQEIEREIEWLKKFADGEVLEYLYADGWGYITNLLDLRKALYFGWEIRVKPQPIVSIYYMNVYEDMQNSVHESQERAEKYKVAGRVCLLEVTKMHYPDGKIERRVEIIR